mgnify:CR=1 FL=1
MTMLIQTTKASLLEALQCVISPIPTRGTMPVLSNVLIECKDGLATFTATDLEIQLAAAAVVEGTYGAITIPAKKLHGLVKGLPDGAAIKIKITEGKALLASGRSKYTLGTLPAADFPDSKQEVFDYSTTVDCLHLSAMISRTSHAQAVQDVRHYLNGTLLELRADGLRLVATDGHRMAVAGADGAVIASVIVPGKAMQQLARMLKVAGDCTVAFNTTSARFTANGTTLTACLIAGSYPKYAQVIPPHLSVATCDRAELIDAIQRAKILAHDKYRGLIVATSGSGIHITASNTDQDYASEEITATVLQGVSAGFNADYLLEALSALSGESVSLSFGPEKPMTLSDDDCTQLVMALRL